MEQKRERKRRIVTIGIMAIVLLLVIALVLCVLIFCGKSEEETEPPAPHEHTFSADWSSDEAYHWHAATCEHADQVADKAPHTYENGACTVCGKAESVTPPTPHEHTFSTDWSSDSTYHWHAATCEHADQVSGWGEHVYQDGACTICAREETVVGGLAFERIGNAYKVVGIGSCTDSDLIIPAVHKGLPVVSIGNYAFQKCPFLVSVTIPDSITEIGFLAFEWCTSLTTVRLPDSITEIDSSAFLHCTSLPYNCYDNAYYLGNDRNPYVALIRSIHQGITSCEMHPDTTCVADTAFSYCYSLSSVTMGESVTHIGNEAFLNCTALTAITIPSGVTDIGRAAFSDCSSLTSVSIPDSVTGIGEAAFIRCTALTYHDYGNAKYLGNDQNPYVVLVRADTGITSLEIHPDTRIIYDGALDGCSRLTGITIPKGVRGIGGKALHNCASLASIVVEEGNPVYHSAGNCLIETESKTLIAGCNTSVIPTDGSVTAIGSYAFYRCPALTTVTIPDGVTEIGREAFTYCPSLTSVTIPGSVSCIGYFSFGCCTSLTDLIISDGVNKIDASAFCGCTSLTSVIIPGSVTSIGERAFRDCASLVSIIIPDSVTWMEAYVFDGCTSLTYNRYNDGQYLGNDRNPYVILVRADTAVTSFGIHPDTKFIYEEAFSRCDSLTAIIIPDRVIRIGARAFSGCIRLSSVLIGNGVTYMGAYAFSTCSSLGTVTIPSSVTSIAINTFYGCLSLASVIFERTDGWQRNGSPVNVSDPERNAQQLKESHVAAGVWVNKS